MQTTVTELEKDPLAEVFGDSISQNYPLYQELEPLSPTEFMEWLESELT